MSLCKAQQNDLYNAQRKSLAIHNKVFYEMHITEYIYKYSHKEIFAKRLKMENHIWKRNIKVFVKQVVDNWWYFENQLSQNVKMQIFQMNVEQCTLHGRQKLSQNLLDVFQVDSFRTYVSKGCQIRSNYSQNTFLVNSLHWVWTFSNVWLVFWRSNNNVLIWLGKH